MVLDRRRLLGGLCAAGSSLVVAKPSWAEEHRAERCRARFRAAAARDQRFDVWRTVDVAELPPLAMQVEGEIPPELSGTLYRNGPAGFERGQARYQHSFDGDGMVQAFRIRERRVAHHGRKVETAKWRAEQAAQRFLYAGAGSEVPNPEPARDNDSANPANTAVVPWGSDLLALWEAGSAHALDPATLETRRRVVWSAATDGMPFSAHPLLEADGRMWNFGLAQWAGPSGSMALYALSRANGLERVTVFELPFPGYMHSFAMTDRSLVFYLAPHVYDASRGGTYVERHRWQPERGGGFLCVDKGDFEQRRWIPAPPGFVFHFADARDGPAGAITVRAAWSDAPSIMSEAMFDVMCGSSPRLEAWPRLVKIELSANGRVRVEPTGLDGEFPVTDVRGSSRFVVLTRGRELSLLDARGRGRSLRAPGQIRLEEHRFVPRGERAGDGWLVGTGYDLEARASVLTIFDTASTTNAPVAVARMERRIPFGFHGWFVRDR